MFLIVDCNNFYASCERVFDPTIRTKPVVVLSNNDGCVIARSQEAKDLGFKMGDPYFQVKALIAKHGVVVFSSNYTLYGDMSRRVMFTLEQFAPENGVEVYSIDEAFLEVGDGLTGDQLHGLAWDIRATVKQWTGIPVGVGVGPTKTLAKAANKLSKRTGGVHVLIEPPARVEALSAFPIEDVWGIGRRWAKMLGSHGVTTALGFSERQDRWIRERMGVVGLRTAMELRGEPCIPLELAPPPRKALMVSRMFGQRVTEFDGVREALACYTSRVGEKLRQARRHARHMMVFCQNSPFDPKEPHYHGSTNFQLPIPTSDTGELIGHAVRGLERVFRPGLRYSKCGLMLTELTPESQRQHDLFDGTDPARSRLLMQTVDSLNKKLGRDTIFYAAAGIERPWKMARTMMSRGYTTNLNEVLVVRA